jgi:cytochrome c553
MHNYYKKIGAALLVTFCTFNVFAADLVAGKNRAMVCQGCHGSAGVSSMAQFPSLAGQSHSYLEEQLNNFKTGTRINAMMQPLTKDLSDADIQNLAAYFASLPSKSAGGDTNLAKQGKDKVTMCLGCHGPKLTGQAQVPRLAGQHPDYLAKQLHDFKSAERKAGHMNMIAKTLSDDDIKAISAYLGTLE